MQTNLLSEGQFFGQNNVEIEEMVLACFINFTDSFYNFSDTISVKDFSTTETRYIFTAIEEVARTSKIDIITITDKIIQKKYHELMYNKIGFDLLVYLNEICSRIDNDQHLTEHIVLLNKYNQRRSLLMLAKTINEKCNEMFEPDLIIGETNSSLVTIQELGKHEEFNSEESINRIITLIQNGEEPKLLKSGMKNLDNFIQGWEAGEMIVVGGAPGMGKTSVALEFFKNFIQAGHNPIFFSLEMTDEALLKRMFSNHADIELRKIRLNDFTTEEVSKLETTAEYFKKQKFWIDYKSRKISKICNHIRKYVLRHKTKVVIIDYLQLIICDYKAGNREQEISTISRTLKELASELDLVLIALSQINRAVNTRSEKRPSLSDLRESGAIEQDADMVAFVYRPDYYNTEKLPQDVEDAEIIIAKGRSTGTGKVDVKFIPRFTKYLSNDEDSSKYENHKQDIRPYWG